jgi:hypothetical protein
MQTRFRIPPEKAMTSFPMPMFFMHIDKAGGLSVISILREHFQSGEICVHPPNEAWYQHDLTGYKLYAGHFSRDFFGGQGGTKLTMLRHPVSRIVSLYDFYRSHRPEYLATLQPPLPGPAAARSGDLTHFLQTNNPDVIEPSSNTVAHRLLGRRFYELQPSEEAVLAEAIRELRDFAWIGITELFEPSIQLLCDTFDWGPPETMPRENSTYDSNNPFLERVERTVPTEKERELILQSNRIDLELYNEARRLLDERMSRQDARLR